ncbi:hypothetical protein EDD16DRAFT_1483393 [Pisolithus croceorrhizus]|nr:hypothetical protein EDD16DRAFT_1483393 [Pisolithus croceorrhizus]KAI6115062.1 hypothetical protein EV401DRAFT_1865619 [Pisolithus croceorrhizus]KAI6161042.1 hypothetical protein EDD17DRAFT_1482190 [Pisolithus thermaeus]
MIIPLKVSDTIEFQTRSLVTDPSPLANTKFILDSASVAGLLGGEEAMSTVALAQIYDRRKWLGWYNTPGSYTMGKRFRRLAHSIVSDSPANPSSGAKSEMVHIDPTLLLQHDGWSKGPVFKGIYSGTSMHETGPLASLLMKKCIRMSGTKVRGRTTQPVNVTIAKLEQHPRLQPQMRFHHSPPICAIIPIAVSLATCAICGLYGEWYAFFMILLGILARGLTCVFIGSGDLVFDHPKSAEGSPPGDGILGCDHELILLRGNENVVNAVTRGRFFYSFGSKNACRMVELCSFFLIAQAIVQLICVPQSDLFGQLMFVLSIATSWVYNLLFLSVDKVEVRHEIFRSVLGSPNLEKSVFPNRSSAVVSLLLSVTDKAHPSDPETMKKIMDGLLPSGSLVWETWKGIVIEHLTKRQPLHFDDTHWNHQDLPSETDRSLLRTLLKDVETACAASQSSE